LDLLLAVVAMSLGMQVFHPVLGSHEDRIRPGAQVRQQYIPVNTGLKYALEEINYLLYLPRDYGTDRKWPLLVFLHGAGEQGDDVEYVRQAELPKLIERGRFFWEHRPNGAAPAQHKPVAVSEQLDATEMMLNRFIILSPQCTLNRVWAPKYVTELIEHVCNSLPVDRDHVYLTGSGRGGSGTWVVASADAGRFAAIVPIGGDGEMRLAKRLKQVPIWAFHGDRDRPRAIKKNHAVVEAINKLGGRAELTVCPGNHGVCELVYQNGKLYEWLLAQRRSPSAAHN
jgi:predicted peptidase